MATKKNLKLSKPQLKQPDMAPIDAVRNPNFDAALAQQDYLNNLAQSLANYKAQTYPTGATKQLSDIEARNLTEQNAVGSQKDVGSLGSSKAIVTSGIQDFIDSRDPNKIYTQDMVDYIDPATGEKVSRTRGIVPAPGSRFVPANQIGMYKDQRGILNPIPIGRLGDQQGSEEQRRMALNPGQPSGGGLGGQMPIPNMPQNKMADFNNLLQQGMQRNQDFNQAAQNLAGMGGPQKSFSQVAGGIGKLNRMPKQPRPNSIAPSNQKLI
jgi:hypothetical protein